MPLQPTQREAAEANIKAAYGELGGIPTGQVRTDVVTAHSEKAQALATMAVAQALLEIGDVLRAGLAEPRRPAGSDS